jgi:hypothetical protein
MIDYYFFLFLRISCLDTNPINIQIHTINVTNNVAGILIAYILGGKYLTMI